MRYLVASLAGCGLAFLSAAPVTASECTNTEDALGVSRILTIDTKNGPLFGTLQYQRTLDLKPKEVVLTFDDGPHPQNTQRVLAALEKECVKATFFPIGTMAEKFPETLQKIADEGHTIGAHSWSHPNIKRLTKDRATSQVERGFRAINTAVTQQIAPFFRFPGLNHTKEMKAYASERGYAIFSTDVSSDDWLGVGPRTIIRRTMYRLKRTNGGIILFHDTKYSTARALPAFLKALKAGGYKIVHIVPEQTYVELQDTKVVSANPESTDVAELGPEQAEVLPVSAVSAQ